MDFKGHAIVFDVAHNPQAARVLAQALEDRFEKKKTVFVIGVMKDKDYKRIITELCPRASHFVFARPGVERAATARMLAGCLPQGTGIMQRIVPEVKNAVKLALTLAGDNPVCITGSFYTVGEAMKSLGIRPLEILTRVRD
jgi:dihydrofolate synthase / folylpolyglutamate synthase